MNHFFAYSLFLGALAFTGCSKGLHSGGSEKQAPVKQISISSMVATHVNDFSFNLLHHIQADQSKENNFFISPLSLHMDLGMVLNGASGTTYDEMLQMMDLTGQSLDEVNQAYKTLLTELPDADPKVQLGLYNSVWYRKTFPFYTEYTKGLEKNFDATVTPLDFKPTDVSFINDWASRKTNGKITKVLDRIQDEDVMFLLNALYFKGDWTSKFDKAKTAPADFHLEDGSSKQVQMMHQQEAFEIYTAEDFMAVRLPYGNGQFAMTVILPSAGKKLDEVLSGIDGTQWETLKDNMAKREVNVGLPRFTIPAYSIKLNDVLQSMGMKSAFNSNSADLSKMADISEKRLFVSFVKQDTYLKVDEEGTEAAAVTTTGIGVTSAPIVSQFICDHPFGIIISEKTSNTILFMGKIMNPDSE